MTPNEYIELAIRTGGYKSKFHGELVPLEAYKQLVLNCMDTGNALDRMKKSLFYGKPNAMAHMPNEITLEQLGTNQELVDILHGIVGICTESTELLEALFKPKLDKVNLKEELGDVLWYVAILCKVLDCSFEQLMEMNIAKLRKRFPERFTEENALNRNLDAERKVLEGSREYPESGDNGYNAYTEAIKGDY